MLLGKIRPAERTAGGFSLTGHLKVVGPIPSPDQRRERPITSIQVSNLHPLIDFF
jgi:hypothetical protein